MTRCDITCVKMDSETNGSGVSIQIKRGKAIFSQQSEFSEAELRDHYLHYYNTQLFLV